MSGVMDLGSFDGTTKQILPVRVKRIDKDLPLPVYESIGAVGMDLVCRETVEIPPQQLWKIPANIIVDVPLGYMLAIVPRSSTMTKYNLIMPNSFGVIDNDYCGEEDELLIQVYNMKPHTSTTVERGDKIAQALLFKVGHAKFFEVDEMSDVSRGGFGSTDKKGATDES